MRRLKPTDEMTRWDWLVWRYGNRVTYYLLLRSCKVPVVPALWYTVTRIRAPIGKRR